MPVTVRFFTLLRLLLRTRELRLASVPGETVDGLLRRSQEAVPTPFLHKLLTEDGQLLTGTIILVNGHNIHHLQRLSTPINEGDVIALFPPGGGG